MDHLIERLLDVIAIGHDQTTLTSALGELSDRFGFSGFAFVNIQQGQSYAVSNYNAEWQRRYFREDLKILDPVMRQAQKYRRTFSWSGTAEKGSLSKEEKEFFAAASDYDIRSGISIPVSTPNGGISVLTFASPKYAPNAECDVDAVAAASTVALLHARIEQLQVAPTVAEAIYMGPKEATYARWLALGKTVEDVADLEGVKYNTVRIALTEVRRRYDLCNNTQLVALAIRCGLI